MLETNLQVLPTVMGIIFSFYFLVRVIANAKGRQIQLSGILIKGVGLYWIGWLIGWTITKLI